LTKICAFNNKMTKLS